jgi:hypothetical protein
MQRNSTIQPKKKKCKCGCGNEDYIFSKGLIKSCWQKQYAKKIPKVSLKKKEQQTTTNEELEKWFKDTATLMKGFCFNCGGTSCKGNIKYQKFSQAHLFAKNDKAFSSIKSNLLNFVELCYFNNSCHSNFDNNGYEYAKDKMPKLWNLILERAKILIPLMTQQEQARIPKIILNNL